jgi:cytochrome c oxidase accessory protein FixG
MAYFVSWEKLLSMMQRSPAESWTTFLFVSFFTALILFDFAWFREQFCIIMCPYGRFQSVLMDQNSINVAYDYNRGEPRKKGLKKEEGQGDCIDCYKCVSVCPTGIDIRRGTQLECIACTACIDACDEVMEKIKRPKGLIRYASLTELETGEKKVLSARLVGYFVVMLLLVSGFAYVLSNHDSFYVSILRQNQRPYIITEEGLMNNFKMHLKNPSMKEVEYKVVLETEGAQMSPPVLEGSLVSNGDQHRPFFVKIPDWQGATFKELKLKVSYGHEGEWVERNQFVHVVFPKD